MNAGDGAEVTAFGGVTATLRIGSQGLCSINPETGSYWDGSTELSWCCHPHRAGELADWERNLCILRVFSARVFILLNLVVLASVSSITILLDNERLDFRHKIFVYFVFFTAYHIYIYWCVDCYVYIKRKLLCTQIPINHVWSYW